MYIAPKFWLGNCDSGDHLLVAMEQFAAAQAAGDFAKFQMRGGQLTRADMGLAPLYSLQDGVGVIKIAGSLISGHAGFMAMFGVTGYDDIRDAFAEALQDPKCKSVMQVIASGGGTVNGLQDAGSFVGQASQIKPLITYADSTMCSAAYWLGSYGKKLLTNETSTIGSLGVVMLHLDKSEMYKAEGVKPTVIRAGQYKQLNNSLEPLSVEAKAEMQAQADTLYQIFINNVANNRGVDYPTADKKMGQGREFLGEAALKAGLVDGLMSYDEAFAVAKSLDTSSTRIHNSRKSPGATMKVTLTAVQLAAVRGGATLESLGYPAGSEVGNPEFKAGEVLVAPEIHAGVVGERDTFKATADRLTGELATASSNLTSVTAELGTVKGQLSTAQAAVNGLTTERNGLKAVAEGYEPVVLAAVQTMTVALGGSADSVAKLTGADLLAKHAEVQTAFQTKFPGAKASATTPLDDKSGAKATANMPHLAILPSLRKQ